MNLQNKMRLGCQRKLLHFGTMEYYHVLNTNTLKSTVVETDTLCINNVNVTDTITSIKCANRSCGVQTHLRKLLNDFLIEMMIKHCSCLAHGWTR